MADIVPLMEREEDEGKTELQVKNLSKDTKEADIRTLFSAYGALVKCKHIVCNRIAFIEFGTHEEAMEARSAQHGTIFEGSELQVDFVLVKKIQVSGEVGVTNTVFCGGLDPKTQESTIRWFFE